MRIESARAVADPFLVPCAAPYGETVVNRAGEELGELAHFVVDATTGRVAYAIVARGGVFGLGERFHPIPWDAFDVQPTAQRLVLDIEAERLDAAPAFHEDRWPDMSDPGWHEAVHAFYKIKLCNL